jgi:hypothetical protein
MLCEHFNTAPCVQCDIEPLEKEIEELQQLVELEAQVSSLYLKEQDQLKGQIEQANARVAELEGHAANMFNAITMDNHALDEASQKEADTALFNSTEDYTIWCEDQPSKSRAWLLRQKAAAVDDIAENMVKDMTLIEVRTVASLIRQAADEADQVGLSDKTPLIF